MNAQLPQLLSEHAVRFIHLCQPDLGFNEVVFHIVIFQLQLNHTVRLLLQRRQLGLVPVTKVIDLLLNIYTPDIRVQKLALQNLLLALPPSRLFLHFLLLQPDKLLQRGALLHLTTQAFDLRFRRSQRFNRKGQLVTGPQTHTGGFKRVFELRQAASQSCHDRLSCYLLGSRHGRHERLHRRARGNKR